MEHWRGRGTTKSTLVHSDAVIAERRGEHEEDTSFLGTEVVRQHAADPLEGQCALFCGIQRDYTVGWNAGADDNWDAPKRLPPE